MRIYPDPDLPDVKVEWYDADCPSGSVVEIEVVPQGARRSGQVLASAPCRDGVVIAKDVERTRVEVIGSLREADGALSTETSEQVDARDGNGQRTYLSFAPPSYGRLRLGWTFTGGVDCASSEQGSVLMELSNDDGGGTESFLCDDGRDGRVVTASPLQAGVYTVRLELISASSFQPVARAAPVEGVVIAPRGVVTELGVVTLAPCDGACAR